MRSLPRRWRQEPFRRIGEASVSRAHPRFQSIEFVQAHLVFQHAPRKPAIERRQDHKGQQCRTHEATDNNDCQRTLHFGADGCLTAFLRQKYGSPAAQVLEAAPPYTEWKSRDAALTDVARGVRQSVDEFLAVRQTTIVVATPSHSTSASA